MLILDLYMVHAFATDRTTIALLQPLPRPWLYTLANPLIPLRI